MSKSGTRMFLLSKHVTGVTKIVELLGNGSVLAFEPRLLQCTKSASLFFGKKGTKLRKITVICGYSDTFSTILNCYIT